MNYRIVIHSIDLQDRKGFLTFLESYAHKGYEAVRIFRSFTVFRKAEIPPKAYSIHFVPEGSPKKQTVPVNPIPGLKNGVKIFPVPGEDDTHWAKTVSTHYTDFVPYDLSYAISVAVRQLVIPIVLLVLLLISGPRATEILFSEFIAIGGWKVIFTIWVLVVIGTEILIFYVDTLHLRGLRKEAKTGQLYSIPASQQRLIMTKNLFLMFDMLPSTVLVIILVLIQL